jgi:hypothetical protein
MAQDMVRLQATANTEMKLWVVQKAGISRPAESISFSRRTLLDGFTYAHPLVNGVLCGKCNGSVGTNSDANASSCSP